MLRSTLTLLACLSTAVHSAQQPDPWKDVHSLQNDYKYGGQGDEAHRSKAFCSWKCLKFTLQWPGAFCVTLNNWTRCRVPEDINTWTIHGLWPQRVQNCCGCWPIFPSDIKELDEELLAWWPSLLKAKSSFQFWKKEWEKHGVCVACVEGMNSPLRYFQISLTLRRYFDIHKVLDEAGVKPSCNQSYKVVDIHSVLAPLLGDSYETECVTDDQGREVWFQVKIPLSRNLSLGCPHDRGSPAERRPGLIVSPGHRCPPEAPLYYFPIDYQQPHQPCG
ncbi:ribonuclease T2-like [Lampris incognitus]|uniref:ribonuclease T2-like n=1 Tax=Lampris incognitus TaxID=2546036 RepID=UPI0024B5F130|nr:ribonuclease T2-like [Lampris incognitus]